MAAYYAPRRPQSVSRRPALLVGVANDPAESAERVDAPLDAGPHSIYIFPNPASAPPSPATSVSSAPTEFDFSSPIDSRSPSRTRPPLSAVSDVSSHGWDITTPSGDDLEIEIALWDNASDFAAEPSDSDESWALEGEVERIGLAEVDAPYAPHLRHACPAPLASGQSPDAARAGYRFSVRPRHRSRTHSRVRTVSISSLALSSGQQANPHPRIHIPLLSFFSSLLSVDLDDPALRLLTNSEPGDAEAILFPGQSSARLLAENSEHPTGRRSFESDSDAGSEATSIDDHDDTKQETHGLPKLLLASISDQSTVALRSLRSGLAVPIPVSVSEFALPLPRVADVAELWRVFGEVCSRGSQAWKEVWTAAATSTGRSAS